MTKSYLRNNNNFPVIETQITITGNRYRVLHQGKGDAVLLCHGFPDTAETWRFQTEALASAGYHAIALDMRGFGGSYAPMEPNLYSAQHIVNDLIAILDHFGIDMAVLVGHDWGADHAQRAMLMYPDRFKALVSLSIPYAPRGIMSYWDLLRKNGFGDKYYAFDLMESVSDEEFMPIGKTFKNILYWLSGSPIKGSGWDPIDKDKGMFRLAPVDIPIWANKEYVEQSIFWFEQTGYQTGINHYRGLQATFDEMSELVEHKIKQPSLYIWGKEDGLCCFFHPEIPKIDDFREFHPGLRKIISLDGVGHWPHLEATEIVNFEIISFLNTLNDNKVYK